MCAGTRWCSATVCDCCDDPSEDPMVESYSEVVVMNALCNEESTRRALFMG